MNGSKIWPNALRYVIFFTVISLLFIMFEFWLENGSSQIYDNIKKVIPEWARSVFFLIAVTALVFYSLYTKLTEYYESEIRQRDELLQDNSKLIWQKYSDLYKFKHIDIIKGVMKKLVDTEDYLIGAQLYKYTWKQDFRWYILKVNHICSYITEGESQNAIEQAYFKIGKRIYIEYIEALGSIYSHDIDTPLQFVDTYTKKLNEKSIEKLNESDAVTFAITNVIAQRLYKIGENIDETTEINIINDNEKMKKLESLCRIGFLSAILADDYYITYNTKSKAKSKRTYLTDTLTIGEEPHIKLITTKPFVDSRFEVAIQYKYFIDEFIKMLGKLDETVGYSTKYDELYYDNDDGEQEAAAGQEEEREV